eukprot:gnl/TRDRNA2_/TRDRNA2_92089_c0_seq1.p1 gnl/TRDRNA2_/TRDRNA2_92089_c0~~gnl/TRDRNA2_/TRDRNA2_92089_c0_seq1.p1  ORF type:complete len:386 (+),score=63.58 gnl/TRDRNA2_/TRDRNA2_92089_c0_seq1:1058-2215(+)
MHNEIPWDHLKGNETAILGNGAFAVENVRTVLEYGGQKAWLVTRRKNLPCPRFCCWFVHQTVKPISARLLLNSFEKMYTLAGFGDPWEYHAVHANAERTNCTIIQASRFGIADVTFLAQMYDKLEYVEDTVKRMSDKTLHLKSGRKLHNITNVIKALGLIGDYEIDRMHKIKEMVGMWVDADVRRPICMDVVGMHASMFTNMSGGQGMYSQTHTMSYFLYHPKEYQLLELNDVIGALPKRKADEWRPAYIYDIKYSTQAGIVIAGATPGIDRMFARRGIQNPDNFKHDLYMRVAPVDQFLEECIKSWDEYQAAWHAQGNTTPYVPYPYNAADYTKYYDDNEEEWVRKMAKGQQQQEDASNFISAAFREQDERNARLARSQSPMRG